MLRATVAVQHGVPTKTARETAIIIARPIIISRGGSGHLASATGPLSRGLSRIRGPLWSRGTVNRSVSYGPVSIVGRAILASRLMGATSTTAAISCRAGFSPSAVLANCIPCAGGGRGQASMSSRAAITNCGRSRGRPTTAEKRRGRRQATLGQIVTETVAAALATAPTYFKRCRAATIPGRHAGLLALSERWYGPGMAAISGASALHSKTQHSKGRSGPTPIKQQQVSINRGYFYPEKSG